jgi:hypothetical protein
MEVTIDRKPHGPEEGVALRVTTTDQDKYPDRQFKIDVWSEKNSGNYQMRLDGLGYLQLWEADALKPLLERLADLHGFDPAQEALRIREALGQTPMGEFTFIHFFDSARAAVLRELGPLAESGTS